MTTGSPLPRLCAVAIALLGCETPKNECLEDNGGCGANAACLDTADAFRCECLPGFTGNGVTCANVDECATGAAKCDAKADCLDTQGSFTCRCRDGYAGDGTTCRNIGECAAHLDACDAHAECFDLDGAYECRCRTGWTGDGRSCVNVDECAQDIARCGEHATCADTPGAWECRPDTGWRLDASGAIVDVDECATAPCGAGLCSNLPGSFACLCRPGFSFDGGACVDHTGSIDGPSPDSATPLCSDVESFIACPPVGAPAWGQDGSYRGTPPQYEVHADTVVDLVTGREWQRRVPSCSLSLAEATTACDTLVLGGHDDWRLPAPLELQSIVDYGRVNPCVDGDVFPDTPSNYHWTRTPDARIPGATWLVSFYGGHVSSRAIAGDPLCLRCVR